MNVKWPAGVVRAAHPNSSCSPGLWRLANVTACPVYMISTTLRDVYFAVYKCRETHFLIVCMNSGDRSLMSPHNTVTFWASRVESGCKCLTCGEYKESQVRTDNEGLQSYQLFWRAALAYHMTGWGGVWAEVGQVPAALRFRVHVILPGLSEMPRSFLQDLAC